MMFFLLPRRLLNQVEVRNQTGTFTNCDG